VAVSFIGGGNRQTISHNVVSSTHHERDSNSQL
jgi:hypothetical protein